MAPLAYMRGRTLDNAYIILDEAQNTTPAQMKMFLTRIGFGSKVVVTGDSSQKDLPSGSQSGLDVATKVLGRLEDIAFCNLTSKDVVRHPLVQKIVKAYEDFEAKEKYRENRRGRAGAGEKKYGRRKIWVKRKRITDGIICWRGSGCWPRRWRVCGCWEGCSRQGRISSCETW